jgi:nitrogen fixation protein FixH
MLPRDKMIPWYFVMFFAFIALVNGVMVTLALRTHTGTVTDHPYEKGLAYNAVVEAAEAQQVLGWSSTITYHAEQLHFTLHDKTGKMLTPTQATAHLSRPTQAGMDFEVPLKNGLAAVKFPLSGQWDVRVDATANGQHYQQTQRLVIP